MNNLFKGLNILSLFDGMSCGQIALERAGIPVSKYYASEIDKWAMKISRKNYPDIIQLGDIRDIRGSDLPKIDLLMGGSPCQGFSFAGKQLNFNDPRSALFFEFVRLLKECKPKYFLLENVMMKKEHQDKITEMVGVEPIQINSALVSAQNRVRLYWTNIPAVAQPVDKGIVLKDIVDDFEDNENIVNGNLQKHHKWKKYKKFATIRPIINTSLFADKKGENNDVHIVAGAIRGHSFFGEKYKKGMQCLDIRKDQKTNTLTTVWKDTVIVKKGKSGLILVGMAAGIKGQDMIRRIYSQNGKCPTLTAVCGGHQEKKIAIDELHYRKLTPIECERLQTVPDYYTGGVSNHQRYRMLGNGWTIDVIAHILKNIKL